MARGGGLPMWGLLGVLTLLAAAGVAEATGLTVALSNCLPAYAGGSWNVSCTATVTNTDVYSNASTIDVFLAQGSTAPDPAADPSTAACTIAGPITANNGQGTCTASIALGAGTSPLNLIAAANGTNDTDSTWATGAMTSAVSVALGSGTIIPNVTTLPATTKAGDTASISVDFVNTGPNALTVTSTGASDWTWSAACPPTSVAAAAGAPPAATVTCTATRAIVDADLEGAALKSWSFAYSTAAEIASPVTGTITLARAASISAGISACTLSAARPAAQAMLNCTATVTNTGNMRLKAFAVAAPTTCTFPDATVAAGPLAAGVSKTCTFTQAIPWANFTTAQNVTVNVTAGASVYSATPAMSVTPVPASTYYTASPMFGLNTVQTSMVPSTVNASGTTALGNFSLSNTGTLNLTNVTYGVVSDTADPRVAAITLYCAGLAQNGTLPAGSSLVQCTETLNFQTITFIEGGDVVFNVTAAADGGVSAATPQTVVIHVDNTPSLMLSLNTSKCTTPAATSRAGTTITCNGAVNLANTGRVRLVVDDIVINSTLGMQLASCTLGGAAINLTALNATLMPGDQLVCSFSAVTTQAAYELGAIIFDVRAVGVAAYGMHPAIAGVTGGVIPANAGNITLNRVSNVTVQSSVIGSVSQDGDTVTYRVQVTNQGNIVLRNVALATNFPAPTWNTSALDDGLDVGEVVVLANNMTFNKTMIRAGNVSLSTNISASSVTANVSAASYAKIVTPWCRDNRTDRPNDHINCLNDTDCGDANLWCDLSPPGGLRPRYTCWQGAVDVTNAFGVCVNTPCRRCQLCLADVAGFLTASGVATDATATDPTLVANVFATYCRQSMLNANRTATACAAAANATGASFQGNAGKRAAVICRNMGECSPGSIPSSCGVGTASVVPTGSLDMCIPSGSNATGQTPAQLPGVVAASAAYAGATCQADVHCNGTAESVCRMPTNGTTPFGQRVVCSPADGSDTVTPLGVCQPAPCRRCSECIADMKTFAAGQAAVVDPAAVAAAFRTLVCAAAGAKYDATACAQTALAIEASEQGHVGKRPALVCSRGLGACDNSLNSSCVIAVNTSSTPTLTYDMVDACTVDAMPYSQGGQFVATTATMIYAADNATAPNVTASGGCYSDADCGAGKCSFAAPKQWCQCQSSNGSESCIPMGTCVLTATCANCASCVAAVGPFVATQQQVTSAAAVAAAFAAAAPAALAANGITQGVQALVDSASAAIASSPFGNVGKRAGVLCTQLQFCVPSMVNDPTCATAINTTVPSGNTTVYAQGHLDLCTAQGLPLELSATKVPGAADNSSNVPFNTCNQYSEFMGATGCDAPDYVCDVTQPQTGTICTCDATSGADDCTKYAPCVKTPCKRCSDCLAHMYAFTNAHMFDTSSADTIRAALATHCATHYAPSACKTATDAITTANGLKRAGFICAKLAECNQTAIMATGACTLKVAPAVNSSDATVDLCAVSGITGGGDLAGTSSNGLPPAMCDTAADCPTTTDYDCNKDAPKVFSLCTRSAGIDSQRQLGTCTLKPKVACEKCLTDFKSVVDAAVAMPAGTTPDALAGTFLDACTGAQGRPLATCSVAAQGIAASFKGNKARRAGAICALLQECKPVNISGVVLVPSGPGIPAGNFSRCLQAGTSAGSMVTVDGVDFPVNPTRTSYCMSDAGCTTAGKFCSMTASAAVALGAQGSCSCSEVTGEDTCVRLGVCVDTPCTQCQKCLTGMRDMRNTSASFAFTTASYDTGCAALTDAPTCANLKARYVAAPASSPPSYYFAMRAGAVCTAMQQCAALPTTCALSGKMSLTQNITGALDLCTAEGVGNSAATQLYNVFPAGRVPATRCLADSDCGSSAMQCDLKNSTAYFTCAQGLDTSVSYGTCIAKPAAPTGTPQQLCSACLTAMRPLVDAAVANMTLSGSALKGTFYTACSGAGYALADCSRVQAAVAGSHGGWLARRAGALCVRLGECSSGGAYTVTANYSSLRVVPVAPVASPAPVVVGGGDNATNSTNATASSPSPAQSVAAAAPTITGAVDTCTIEGIVGGTVVPGSLLVSDKSPNATCVGDATCGANSFCSSDAVISECRCVDGLDSCDMMATCKPIPTPPTAPPPDTRTNCQKCKDCIAAVQPWIAATAVATNDSLLLATSFMQNCSGSMTGNNVLACRAVAGAIAFSLNGNLAKRAGAICSRLGNCSMEAASPRCNVTATARLDVCTQEGSVGGTPVLSMGSDNTTCSSDSNCSGGQICSKAAPTRTCTCSDGTDACQLVGTCIDFCASRQAYINAVNSALPKCNSPFDQCGTGLQCVASAQCRQLTCSAAAGIATTPCYGLCTPTTRTILGATLSDDGRSVSVALNTPAGEASFPCKTLFDTTTIGKVGQGAQCSVSGSKLTAQLARDASIMPGDAVVLSSSQTVLVDVIDPTAKFTSPATAVTLAACSNCATPMVIIAGPQSVPEPCDPSTAADVVFDGSFSADGMGRALASFSWDQVQATKDVVLSSAIAAANGGNDAPRLVIPGAALSKISNGPYTLRLTATNYLGITAHGDATFTKLGSGATPVVTVLGGQTQAFTVSGGVRLSTKLMASSVCANKQVVWSWVSYDGWSAMPSGYSRKDLVIPGPIGGVASPSDTKLVGLTAYFADTPSQVVNVNVTLVPVFADVSAMLRGPSGDVRADRDIVLNASSSFDPNDPQNTNPFAITWTCTREDFPSPCFTGTDYGAQSGLAWTIKGALLTADKQHTFTANVAKGSRTDAASIVLRPTTTAIPTGSIVRKCGGAGCPARHNADKDLALSMQLFAGSDGATVAWSSDQVANMAAMAGAKTDIVIPASALPSSGSVSVAATVTNAIGASTTTITVPINGQPSCSGASCLTVTAVTSQFPGATFNAKADGFTDDMPGLRYDFGIQNAAGYNLLASGPSPTLTITGLPVGATTLYVCAVDTDGAQLCQGTSLTVDPAAADFKVTDALTSFNVSQLAGSGDVGVLAAGAQTLSSLSTFASTAASTQTPDEQKQVAAALAVKANSMIKVLANGVNNYLDDPQTMKSIVSTTGIVLATTPAISSDSRAKGKAVSSAGITSAKLSPTPLDPKHGSKLLGVYAVSSGVSATPSSATGSSRRRLLAASEAAAAGRQLLQSNATNVTSPSPAPTPSPAPAPAVAFVPTYAQTAMDVAGLLLRGAMPGSPMAWLSAGSNGLYVAVVNQLGRTYAPTLAPALAVGPALVADGSRADASDPTNVPITISASLVGTCTDDNGASITDASCAVPVVAVYTPDASGALAPTASAAADLPSDFAPVSGAVILSAGGAASGALPCVVAGCTATLAFPVTEAANVTKLYKCVHVVAGVMTMDATVPTAASRLVVTTGASHTYSCQVKEAGTYLVGSYSDPSYVGLPSQGLPELATYDNVTGYDVGKPIYAAFEFAMASNFVFADFIADATKVATFKAGVKAQLAQNLRVTQDSITITNIYQGSIIVETTFDTSALTAAQLNSLVGTIQNRPSVLFDASFQATWGIVGITSKLLAAPAAPGPNVAAIVGGVVGGVGGALVVGLVAYCIIKKRRAAGVEPRGALLVDDAGV